MDERRPNRNETAIGPAGAVDAFSHSAFPIPHSPFPIPHSPFPIRLAFRLSSPSQSYNCGKRSRQSRGAICGTFDRSPQFARTEEG
jgi:hypothetical protein